MSKYWSGLVRNIEPYVPGEQPKDKTYIKLNTNENPYPPSPKVLEAMKQAANENIRLYPTPTCDELRSCIAQYYGLTNKEQVFMGNGSDELLAFVFLAFFNPGSPILFPDITYSFYPVYASLFHIDYRPVPLDGNFSIPIKEFFKKNGGIIFPNPNAPTGKYITLGSIEDILKQNTNQVVVVDEAYIDFGGESAVKLINNYPNLLVVQTLSKSRSLAGLRVGFAMGHEDLIEGINRVKNSINSYTLDRVALAGAMASFADEEYFQNTRRKVIATREKTIFRLLEIGFTVIPSQANFIFISHPLTSAGDIYQQLREKGILVRYFNKPRIDNFLRVSIGSDEEMEYFLKALAEIIDAVCP
ncbi:MAG TPA: histidinol-phosphate transaminase [Methylomusa anaerophila]|uniref:Histidinol-phosphate aminotransferase n=1 Tax=Methylomusa anaerophila TaxID=1930071 RepID=A0A348AF49_9FIRM|nr:histidinol-phosphate transaminase [Methylomusa anaerophila]BBB89697.1 histidinol-phosphate aminotransferase [Methylomusa anaerophila]HML89259.1 histidinol-phosphate transaminase [Methylomusa anaerophila]